jgi:hypothetical protein
MPKISLHIWSTVFRRLNVVIALFVVISVLFFAPQAFCFERPKDFRGIKWGTDISQIEGLVLNPYEPEPDSRRYTRPSDSLEIAGGKVDAISYCFVNNRLTKVVLHFKGIEQFDNMKSAFFNLYGPPDKQKEEVNKKSYTITYDYYWYASSDDEANVKLQYDCSYLSGQRRLEIVGAVMEWKGSLKGKSGL